MRGLGDTEAVLAAYETHVRLQDARAPQSSDVDHAAKTLESNLATDVQSLATSGKRAGLVAAQMSVQGEDLVIAVTAVSHSDETPSVGVMLEQFQGVGVTSVATHADGVKPIAIESKDGWTTWKITLTFQDLPLHSGHYCLSFYLFDTQGLVVYDEWKDHIDFQWVSPSLTPGLVRLPHRWS